MNADECIKFLEFISPFVTDHKKARIEEVLQGRTRHLTVVLEDIYQSQNASAVVRSCECLGIQDVHIVEQRNTYKTNRDVLRGAGKWVTMHRYKTSHSVRDCFKELRARGYQVVAAEPDPSHNSIDALKLNQKTAIIFGTELEGLSEYALNNVDEKVRIPMSGFTESFNLSVSAAILMYQLTRRIKEEISDWQLPEKEKISLKVQWYLKSVRNPAKLEREFYRLNLKV